jgi:hypothetical protein
MLWILGFKLFKLGSFTSVFGGLLGAPMLAYSPGFAVLYITYGILLY